jgi:Fe-S cluster assembly ATP-binding protein
LESDKENLLDIEDLVVNVDDKEILHNVNLSIPAGETQVIFGPNGGGKTTLLMTIMGFPRYKVTHGKIFFKGTDITHMPVDERARLGIGIMFQRPPVVRGVRTRDMVAACSKQDVNEQIIEQLAEQSNMTDFLNRDINYGFSGGEIKRSELLQLLAQSPNLILLDEPESGVDLENIALIGSLINDLLGKVHPIRNVPQRVDYLPYRTYPELRKRPHRICYVRRENHLQRRAPGHAQHHQRERLSGVC